MRLGALVCSALMLLLLAASSIGPAGAVAKKAPPIPPLSAANKLCVNCHTALNPALTSEWHDSAHAKKGIGCFDCHRADKTDPDAFEHNGATIAVIVSPKDCGRCHQKEVEQQKGSHHAKAGDILASVDNFLGEVIGGPPPQSRLAASNAMARP